MNITETGRFCFTLYQKTNFRSVSTNKKLTGITALNSNGNVLKKITVSSLFIFIVKCSFNNLFFFNISRIAPVCLSIHTQTRTRVWAYVCVRVCIIMMLFFLYVSGNWNVPAFPFTKIFSSHTSWTGSSGSSNIKPLSLKDKSSLKIP